MRRMSASDIVITADDRPGAFSGGAPRRAQAPERNGPAPEKPAKAAKARKPARRRAPPRFSPVQKFAAAGVAIVALAVGGAVLWHSGAPQRLARNVAHGVLDATAQAGFRLAEITVTGRNRTTEADIVAALGIRLGDPILGIDIDQTKDRLETIPTVRAAAVQRRLPGALSVVIAERQPVALWQHDGEFVLVDHDGHQIPGSIAGYENLLLVVGDGAPIAAADLLELLAAEPSLAPRVKAAVRVGARRWDLRLDDSVSGMIAKLPEENVDAAWHKLAELEGKRGLSQRRVTMIDLRLADRMLMKTDQAVRQESTDSAGRHKDNGA